MTRSCPERSLESLDERSFFMTLLRPRRLPILVSGVGPHPPDGGFAPPLILRPSLPSCLDFREILLDVFDEKFAAEFEITGIVVPLQSVDLTRLAITLDYKADAVFGPLGRMAHMRRQKIYLAFSHDDLASL